MRFCKKCWPSSGDRGLRNVAVTGFSVMELPELCPLLKAQLGLFCLRQGRDSAVAQSGELLWPNKKWPN